MCSSDALSLVYHALGIGVISHQKKTEREKCKAICSDPVSTSPVPWEEKAWPWKQTSPSFLACQASHPSFQAGSGQQWPASSPPFMTLSIRCQALALASLLTIIKIFLTAEQPVHHQSSPELCGSYKRLGRHDQLGRACPPRCLYPQGQAQPQGLPRPGDPGG